MRLVLVIIFNYFCNRNKNIVSMRFILLACLLCMFSCKIREKKEVPLIPEKKLVSLLVDFHLATAISYTDLYRKKTKTFGVVSLKDSVIKHHGYTKAIFDSTISFYSGSPAKFEKMYDKVIDELNLRLAKTQQHNKNLLENNEIQRNINILYAKDLILRGLKFPKVFPEDFTYRLTYPAKFNVFLTISINNLYPIVPKFVYIKIIKTNKNVIKPKV